jgi:tetratricopeptide (TPR) repeat protein
VGPGQRVIAELSSLEKALGKNDLPAQKQPLEAIVRSLRSMRLKSLDDLELNVKGRLMTSLLRVQRQPRPPMPEGFVPSGAQAPAAPAAAGEAGSALGNTGVVAQSTLTPPGTGGNVPGESNVGISEGSPTATQEQAEAAADQTGAGPAGGGAMSTTTPATGEGAGISEGSPTATQEQAQAADPAREKYVAWVDVMFLVGRAWRAAGDSERAASAFTLSGRQPTAEAEEPAARPSGERREGREGERREGRGERREGGREGRGERREGREGERREGGREGRGERREGREGERREGRGERRERGPAGERRERPPLPELTGDWQEQSKQLETAGRTRDAARLHERNNSFAEAIRLFEAGADLKSALRCALAAKDQDTTRRLLGALPPDQVPATLEKAGAYELLMEYYNGKNDFENMARLYERARQFDQAGLAYERANKLSLARKAYERARDFAAANRMRDLEVKSLVERGDRLGAATLLVAAGRRAEASEVLGALPPPKAFHFLQRLKLEEEAKTLAQKELARAESENKPAGRARWLELLGEVATAAPLYEQIGRKEKALALYEQIGHLPKAAALAEELQLRDKATALYTQLGDSAGVERAKNLPETPPARQSAAKGAAGEEAGEGADSETDTPEDGSSSAPAANEQESQ